MVAARPLVLQHTALVDERDHRRPQGQGVDNFQAAARLLKAPKQRSRAVIHVGVALESAVGPVDQFGDDGRDASDLW